METTTEHIHTYTPTFRLAHFTGNPVRDCTDPECSFVTMDAPDYCPPERECDGSCDECGRSMRMDDAYEDTPDSGGPGEGGFYCPDCWWG